MADLHILPLDNPPDPVEALERVADRTAPVLLDGAADRGGLGRWSYLAAEPAESLEGCAEEWPAARDRIRQSLREAPRRPGFPPFCGGWIGWLSYELGRAFDRQPTADTDSLGVPDFSLARYPAVVAWDHATQQAWVVGEDEGACQRLRRQVGLDRRREIRDSGGHPDRGSPVASHLLSTFTPDGYRAAVRAVIDRVLAGDIFQANLSQQFTLPFRGDPVTAYRALRARAPGSHGAFLTRGRHGVLSMSPELFLRFDPATRRIESRPIKGTRPRDADPSRDTAMATALLASEKDRAENVMIVDLVRNDLSRVATPGSVQVPSLCRLESYAAVHHLVSVVTAALRPECDALDLIAATFPAGSITGAPKLRAMAILAELEPTRRGVYCGSIGWIGLDGGMELNVAIRTVTIVDGLATVPAGGGVTALSEPGQEYQESLDKARALLDGLASTP